MNNEITSIQKEVCRKYGVEWFPSPSTQKLGIAQNVRTGTMPVNGLRHPPAGDTTGWYIWAGTELSKSPSFFDALHVEHIKKWCPMVEKFLGLPPGWRFLVTEDYEDVWFDESLLQVESED